jgi:ribosomal protein S27E
MPSIIITRLPVKCPKCGAGLPTEATLTDQTICKVLGYVSFTLLIGGPIAVYYMFKLADEAHHGISIKMILVSGFIGILPSIGLITLAGMFKKFAKQICPGCKNEIITMVKVKDKDEK